MKYWAWYIGAVVLVAALGWMPFLGTDVARLRPVELISVSQEENQILLETDTGDSGRGQTLELALEDLYDSTPGEIFLETAEYLLITPEGQSLLPELTKTLRPSCKVCLREGEMDLAEAAAYLSVHEPELTLQDYRTGEKDIPKLKMEGERGQLVP
ncbi:MAG TPA: hypothetical protein IAB79_08610 [Candidatus Faecousia excrementipullorum]|nr:hypothetical protein [Candidatus Faecousia excrementipullorum]